MTQRTRQATPDGAAGTRRATVDTDDRRLADIAYSENDAAFTFWFEDGRSFVVPLATFAMADGTTVDHVDLIADGYAARLVQSSGVEVGGQQQLAADRIGGQERSGLRQDDEVDPVGTQQGLELLHDVPR